MFSFLASLFGAIPGISSAVQYVVGKVYDSKVAIKTAQIGGDSTVAAEMVKASATTENAFLSAVSHSHALLYLVVGFALPYMIWEWKIIVYDNILGWGTTDPIKGLVADWAAIIIPSLFGSSTIAAVGGMYFANRSK